MLQFCVHVNHAAQSVSAWHVVRSVLQAPALKTILVPTQLLHTLPLLPPPPPPEPAVDAEVLLAVVADAEDEAVLAATLPVVDAAEVPPPAPSVDGLLLQAT